MIKNTLILIAMMGIIIAGGMVVTTMATNQKVFATPATDACLKAPDNPYCDAVNKGSTENPITKTIGNAVQLFALIGGAVAVIWIMYGGFKYITSDGDSGRVEEARKTILYGVVGLVVLLSAQLLVTLIINAVNK